MDFGLHTPKASSASCSVVADRRASFAKSSSATPVSILASILAKVTRDSIMQNYDKEYPQYGFSQHKGYATRAHLNAIEQFGFCAIHRRTFHPKRFLNSQLWSFRED